MRSTSASCSSRNGAPAPRPGCGPGLLRRPAARSRRTSSTVETGTSARGSPVNGAVTRSSVPAGRHVHGSRGIPDRYRRVVFANPWHGDRIPSMSFPSRHSRPGDPERLGGLPLLRPAGARPAKASSTWPEIRRARTWRSVAAPRPGRRRGERGPVPARGRGGPAGGAVLHRRGAGTGIEHGRRTSSASTSRDPPPAGRPGEGPAHRSGPAAARGGHDHRAGRDPPGRDRAPRLQARQRDPRPRRAASDRLRQSPGRINSTSTTAAGGGDPPVHAARAGDGPIPSGSSADLSLLVGSTIVSRRLGYVRRSAATRCPR